MQEKRRRINIFVCASSPRLNAVRRISLCMKTNRGTAVLPKKSAGNFRPDCLQAQPAKIIMAAAS